MPTTVSKYLYGTSFKGRQGDVAEDACTRGKDG